MGALCCVPTAKWKRELVVDHKFAYINMDDYKTKQKSFKLKFVFMILLMLRLLFTFITDILAVVFLFASNRLSNTDGGAILSSVDDDNFRVAAPYIYLACLLASIILFIIDVIKARRIVKSGDISHAFTNTIAYRYYSIRQYSYYCFFQRVNEMGKTKDQMALFVYFRLRSKS